MLRRKRFHSSGEREVCVVPAPAHDRGVRHTAEDRYPLRLVAHKRPEPALLEVGS